MSLTEEMEEQLSAYLDGELSPAASAQLEQLVATNAEAAQFLNSLRELGELTRHEFSKAEQTAPLASMQDRVLRELRLHPAQPSGFAGAWERWHKKWGGRIWLTLPATAALGCLLWLGVRGGSSGTSAPVVENVDAGENNVMVFTPESGRVTVVWIFPAENPEGSGGTFTQ